MSYHATRAKVNSSFTAGYDIQSKAGLAGLPSRSQAENNAVRQRVGKFIPVNSFCPNGLMALSDKGIKAFQVTHPGVLPWNLYKAGPAGQGYYDHNIECKSEVRNELVEAHARFGGWMRAAAGLPLLAKAIKNSVSPKGEHSRSTHVSLWKLAEKYPSPHKLQRLIGAVQNRAIGILRAYDGRGCTLRSALIALEINGNVGKAALIAAHRSLTGSCARSYREARKSLIELHFSEETVDTRDGVTVHRNATPALRKMGIEVYSTVQKSKGGWKRGWLVLRGEQSFHIFEGRYGFLASEWVDGTYRNMKTPQGPIHVALAAWKRANEAVMMSREKFKNLLLENVTVLVTRQDSYLAGNCEPGTDEWIKSTGIGDGRWCVPVSALLPRAQEPRVTNVLAVVNRAAGEYFAMAA